MQNSTNYTCKIILSILSMIYHSVTIVGHHVTNMREWASDFLESPLLFMAHREGAEPSFNWPIIFII